MNIFVIVSENSILTTCLFKDVREFLMKISLLLRFVFEGTKVEIFISSRIACDRSFINKIYILTDCMNTLNTC